MKSINIAVIPIEPNYIANKFENPLTKFSKIHPSLKCLFAQIKDPKTNHHSDRGYYFFHFLHIFNALMHAEGFLIAYLPECLYCN